MKKQRKLYSPEERVAILRRHLLDKEPISKLLPVGRLVNVKVVGLETQTPARQADSHPAIRELIRLTAGV